MFLGIFLLLLSIPTVSGLITLGFWLKSSKLKPLSINNEIEKKILFFGNLFFICCLISTFISPFLTEIWKEFFEIAVYWMVFNSFFKFSSAGKLNSLFTIGYFNIVFILYFLSSPHLKKIFHHPEWGFSLELLMRNDNFISCFIGMTLFILIEMKRTSPYKLIFNLFIILNGVVLAYCFSLNSVIGIFLVSLYTLIKNKQKSALFLIKIVIILIPIIVSANNFSRVESLKHLFSENNRHYFPRIGVWTELIKRVSFSPLIGNGIGSSSSTLVNNSETFRHAHNYYLELLYETGLAGFCSFILMNYYLLQKMKHIGKDKIIQPLCLGILFFLLNQLFDSTIYSSRIAILYWMYSGIILGYFTSHSLPVEISS